MTPTQLPPSHSRHGRAKGSLRTVAWAALLLSLLLIVAACGDEGGDAATDAATETAAPATTATESGGDSEEDPDVAADPDDAVPAAIADLASESGSATVTIGDETFEFSLAGTSTVDGTTYVGRCQSLFGMIIGNGYATDGRDITVDMEIPPTDWETYEDERFDAPTVEVEDGVANASWVADQTDEFVTGGGVGEYEQEGETASGAATFVNQWAPDSEPVEGSFDIDCGA